MAVSAVGTNPTFNMVRRLAAATIAIFLVLGYLYGPAATPGLRNSAANECNDYAHGNYRSFRLGWEVGWRPHWTCWDASSPDKPDVNLGWWTNPFSGHRHG
jgi:hypothetical protein